jgi:hypothetical protein
MAFFGLLGNKSAPAAEATAATPATETVAAESTEAAVPAASQSLLEQHKDLWQPATTEQTEVPPLFAVDQSKLMEAAGKLDFTKLVKPEQLQAISRGGDEAAQAFLQAINAVGQAGFANALSANVKLIEQALERKEAEFEARIPGAIKSFNIESSLSSDPILKHPAARPVVGAIAKAMSAKNPDATPAELQESALNLLREIAGEGKETKAASQQQQQREKAGNFDWDNWIAQ